MTTDLLASGKHKGNQVNLHTVKIVSSIMLSLCKCLRIPDRQLSIIKNIPTNFKFLYQPGSEELHSQRFYLLFRIAWLKIISILL